MQSLSFVSSGISSPRFARTTQAAETKKENVPQPYNYLVRNLGQLLSTVKLYGFNHKMFKEKLNEVFPQVNKLLSLKQSLAFFESEGTLVLNRREIKNSDISTKRLTNSLRDLDAGYITLEPGLTIEEFIIFMHLLNNESSLKGEEKIKQYLKEKGVEHIIVRSATYKLVEEDEKVVKRDDTLVVEELSFEIRKRFLDDFKKGEVGEKLLKEEQKYRTLAHNPVFLAETVFNLVKDKSSPEELAKVIWLIGDYLIGEVDSSREEKINRKAIKELKKQIFSLWGEQINKADMEKHIQKTFAAISLASQLKSLVLLHEKHKKGIDKTASKIQGILEVLPPQSQLYRQTKEKLDKIGLFSPQKANK